MSLTNTQLLLSQATPVLTREVERQLFESLRDAKDSVEILKEIDSRSQELEAAKRRVRFLKTEIVNANLPLIVKVAKYFECPGISEAQFVSEGLMKLLQCIDAFNVEYGWKFSTYLQRPLYRHFNRFIKKETKRNWGRFDAEMVFKTEIAEDMVSEAEELVEVLENNTAGLDAMEKTIISHAYGIGQLAPKTLKQLSDHFGLSTGRIKKTLARTIDKLKNALIEEDTNVSE